MTQIVTEVDHKVLSVLMARGEQAIELQQLAAELKIDQAQVSAWCVTREAEGKIAVETLEDLEFSLTHKALEELSSGTLPERIILAALAKHGGAADVTELPQLSGLSQKQVGQALRWLEAKQWAEKAGRSVKLNAAIQSSALPGSQPDEVLVALLVKQGKAMASDLRKELDLDAALKALQGRGGLLNEKPRRTRLVKITSTGKQWLSEIARTGVQAKKQVNQLTPEQLRSGEWRNVELRPYDVTLAGNAVHPGKIHPLVTIFQETRRVFFELGFSEITSPYVESGFWDFDALFQPQDHPARDMQDTFYVQKPTRCRLPDAAMVDRVRRTHENGGDTGSLGWRYRWNPELAHRPLLRTHSTAGTIRALAANPQSPRKVFLVGPVFRRETIDYKHLPVFHQVDGIIIDEKANFATLLGTLQAFYQKMGFTRFQFRPAFFPYTEPSVEVFVWSDRKGDWVEMGGSGMFRPEVTEPFGCKVPVLAWGLGLERLAMFRYELGAISELYRARLDWLKGTPLCQS